MARVLSVVWLLALLAAGCSSAEPPAVAFEGTTASPAAEPPLKVAPTAPQREVAWRHLATTEGMLPDRAAAAAVESTGDLAAAWQRQQLPGSPPDVDFDRSFVLLLGQPDDACVDELIGLAVRDGALKVRWLPPPGGCNLPLIFRVHAVEVDRRHVPSTFTVAFEEPFAADANPVTIEVATVDGPAPAAPKPPPALTEADLDAVFKGHAVRRCTKADDPLAHQPDSRVVTDDPPPRDETRASALSEQVHRFLRQQGYRSNVDFVPYISRATGVRPGFWVDGGAAPKVQRLLDDEFGNGAVLVVENRYDFEAIDKAQRDIGDLMGGDGPGSIVFSSGIPGPVELGMIDPTREALDRVAATVDPSLVCVEPTLSGVTTDG